LLELSRTFRKYFHLQSGVPPNHYVDPLEVDICCWNFPGRSGNIFTSKVASRPTIMLITNTE
jgi:hypothetical protein